MGHGEFKIAKQLGKRGFYGKVSLEAAANEGNGDVQIHFNDKYATRWQNGARFGIAYVLDHISKRKYFPNGGRVDVESIEGHEVDTDDVLIAYVAANALFAALGIGDPKKQPNLDEELGVVAFPR